MNAQTVFRYLNGDNKMPLEFIERILAHFPDVSAEWVMRGEGRMYHAEHYATVEGEAAATVEAARPSAEQPSGVVAAQEQTIAALRDTIAAKDELIAELKKRCATLEDAEAEKCGVA